MTIAEMYDILPLIPENVAVLIVGETGIGKSTIVRNYVKNTLHLELSEFNCAEAGELGDILGMPDIEDGHTINRPPPWFVEDKPIGMFLDEINRPAAMSILKGLMGFANERKLGSLQLAKGSRIFCAINPDRHNIYEVLHFDPAQNDRFFVIELEPTPEEWIAFGRENNFNPTVLDYIENNKTDLDTFGDQQNVDAAKNAEHYTDVLPTRRSWHRFSASLSLLESKKDKYTDNQFNRLVYLLACGYVGMRIASKFQTFYANVNKMVSVSDVLNATTLGWVTLGFKLKRMCTEQTLSAKYLSEGICAQLSKEEESLWNSNTNGASEKAKKYAANFYKYMTTITPELLKHLYYSGVKPTKNNDAMWAKLLVNAEPRIADKFESMITSK